MELGLTVGIIRHKHKRTSTTIFFRCAFFFSMLCCAPVCWIAFVLCGVCLGCAPFSVRRVAHCRTLVCADGAPGCVRCRAHVWAPILLKRTVRSPGRLACNRIEAFAPRRADPRRNHVQPLVVGGFTQHIIYPYIPFEGTAPTTAPTVPEAIHLKLGLMV